MMDEQQEYSRIKTLFADTDEKQLALVDGAIWEAARLRVELNRLHEIVAVSGLIKMHPDNPMMQKELPVARQIVRIRANYLNYIAKLSAVLGKTVEDIDDPLKEFE